MFISRRFFFLLIPFCHAVIFTTECGGFIVKSCAISPTRRQRAHPSRHPSRRRVYMFDSIVMARNPHNRDMFKVLPMVRTKCACNGRPRTTRAQIKKCFARRFVGGGRRLCVGRTSITKRLKRPETYKVRIEYVCGAIHAALYVCVCV